MSYNYVFKSERLGFRNWLDSDLALMSEINADVEVMEYFISTADTQQTASFILRMQTMYARTGFCYFAVDRLDTHEFIGFIGLCEQNYEVEFCTCIDIGWRLSKKHWNLGFATEGALASLHYAQKELNLNRVVAVASCTNLKSIKVMEKIGMQEVLKFQHPALLDYARLVNCVCYTTR